MQRTVALACLLGLGAVACESETGGAYARRIEEPTELIGGPGALGAVGDFAIGNDKIRVIVQNQGWSRGFGIFGGGIIDADIVRPGADRDGSGGKGRDNFGEFFPALFLQAFDVADQAGVDPQTGETITLPGIEVRSDGSDGGEAVIRTRATGGDLLTMVSELVNQLVPRGLRFETDYIISPQDRHVKIVGRIINTGFQPLDFTGLSELLGQFGFGDVALQLPLGDVTLFGAGNQVFAAGAVDRVSDPGNPKPIGFDLRWAVEESYNIARELPALPGVVVDFLATRGPDVSYGLAIADTERNYVHLNKDQYQRDSQVTVSKHSMLVPFLFSSFTGAYYAVPPDELAAFGDPSGRDVFEYTKYFMVGSGDVASIRDELYRIRGHSTGSFEGKIVDAHSGAPQAEASLHVFDAHKRPFSQIHPDELGRFVCRLEAGVYYYRVTAPGQYPFPEIDQMDATRFEIEAGKSRYRHIRVEPPAELLVQVRDGDGRLLPAKVTLVSRFAPAHNGKEPRDFLFDFSLGESRRATDLSWQPGTVNPNRQFVEQVLFTDNGFVRSKVRDSRCHLDQNDQEVCDFPYDIYVSRGMEYDLWVKRGVQLRAGRRVQLDAVLHRVVDTADYIATDLHIHSIKSLDSFAPLQGRVLGAAGEGVELMVSSDHNAIADYQPVIVQLGLQDWVGSAVGVELTTLEMGHFNAFPLRYDIGSASHFSFVRHCKGDREQRADGTAFDWVLCTPQEMFDQMRALGLYGADATIVQVNHPRDTIMGYFNQYFLNPYSAVAETVDPANSPSAGFFVYPQNDETGQFDPESFSFDFDVLEVFNGKRLDLMHSFRLGHEAADELVASLQDPCQGGHSRNGRGEPILQLGGHPKYPGGMDDWMHMLNRGYAITATGNSDTHGIKAEFGAPRTYVYVPRGENGQPRDDPSQYTPLDLVEGLRMQLDKEHGGRVLATNGPFVTMAVRTVSADWGDPPCSSRASAEGCKEIGCKWDARVNACKPPMGYWHAGQLVTYVANNAGLEVDVEFRIQSAPWIDVARIVVFANGVELDAFYTSCEHVDTQGSCEAEAGCEWEPAAGHCQHTGADQPTQGNAGAPMVIPRTYVFEGDTVLVAEVFGNDSLFPIVTPREDPPTAIGSALQGLASGLGAGLDFGGTGDGISAPSAVQAVTPYAILNPIFVDIDADGRFTPPGNPPGVASEAEESCPEPRSMPAKLNIGALLFAEPSAGQHHRRWDVRRVFHAVHGH